MDFSTALIDPNKDVRIIIKGEKKTVNNETEYHGEMNRPVLSKNGFNKYCACFSLTVLIIWLMYAVMLNI